MAAYVPAEARETARYLCARARARVCVCVCVCALSAIDCPFSLLPCCVCTCQGTTGTTCNGSSGTQPRGSVISNNVFHELGLYGKQGTGIFQALSMESVVSRNVIFNGPRSGILFNDGMGGGHRVEHNVMFNLCRETTDHG